MSAARKAQRGRRSGARPTESAPALDEETTVDVSDVAAEAAGLALRMGSAAVDIASFMAELGQELPVIKPVLKTLITIRDMTENVKSNRDELAALEERCTYITACFVVKIRHNFSSAMVVAPLEDCIEVVEKFAERCSRRGKFSRVMKVSSDRSEIAQLNRSLDRLSGDLGLAGIATLDGKVDDMRAMLKHVLDRSPRPPKLAKMPYGTPVVGSSWPVEHGYATNAVLEALACDAEPRLVELVGDSGSGKTTVASEPVRSTSVRGSTKETLTSRDYNHPHPLATLAKVPNGTPALKSWHIERHHLVAEVVELLTGDEGPRLVGLVGDSGSGKTTAAAEIVRNAKVREAFSDGIVWLSVNDGAQERLPSSMLQLARMVHEDIRGSVGPRPAGSGDGAIYVKGQMEEGHGGKGLKCLLVIDNVWEEEVVRKFCTTGMWILLTTRDAALVKGPLCSTAVEVDELSKSDAGSVLLKAAELPDETRLPDDAVELIELCGRVAMDVAFVGRWSTVRCRPDRTAWRDAADKIRTQVGLVGTQHSVKQDRDDSTRAKNREAILRAGFDNLGSDNEHVQRLYLSLAVLPDGTSFTAKDAAVLLHDRTPNADDRASAQGVVGVLERWSVLRSEEGKYRMHDAHSGFARERLKDDGHVRRHAVERWVRSLSSLEVLRSVLPYDLKALWLAVEQVGGDRDRRDITRPYAAALAEMDESDPSSLVESLKMLSWFQDADNDWKGMSETGQRLLRVQRRSLGGEHPHIFPMLRGLAFCAERLVNAERMAECREEERKLRKLLPSVVRKIQAKIETDEVQDIDDAVALASIALNMQSGPRAERLLRLSLKIQETHLKSRPDCVLVAYTLYDLGVLLIRMGRPTEAKEVLTRCLGILESKRGRDDVRVSFTLYSLGVCVRHMGRSEEAEEFLVRCLKIQEAKLDPRDTKLADTLHQLGVCLREKGRLMEAAEALSRSLAARETKLGQDCKKVAKTRNELKRCIR